MGTSAAMGKRAEACGVREMTRAAKRRSALALRERTCLILHVYPCISFDTCSLTASILFPTTITLKYKPEVDAVLYVDVVQYRLSRASDVLAPYITFGNERDCGAFAFYRREYDGLPVE